MPAQILYFPAEEIHVLKVTVDGLIHAILALAQNPRAFGECEGVVVHALFTGGWYVFDFADFQEKCAAFAELDAALQTEDAIKEIFDIHEYRQVPHVAPGARTSKPAVALSGTNALTGAWLRREKTRGATRGGKTRGRDAAEVDFGVIGGAVEPEATTLRRTPHMDFSPAPPAAPGSEFAVEIFADTAAPAADEDSEPIVIEGTEDEFVLEVWLAASAEFEVLGAAVQPLRILRNEARSSSASFRVKVRAEATTGRLAALTASFSRAGRPCGRVTRTVLIGAANTKPAASEKARERDFAGSVSVEAEPPPPADITVVVACPDGEADRYEVKVTVPALEKFKAGVVGPWKLRAAAGDLVKTMMTKFTKAGISNEQRLDNLVGAGRDLFNAAPAHFREAFWAMMRRGLPLRNIYILSEEPHIPWELMVPDPAPADDTGRSWKPLGVEFAIGRWVHEGHVSPPGSVSLTGACVVAPDYTGTAQAVLKNAVAESEYVRANFGGMSFAPVLYKSIRERIATEMAPLLHFVGHGGVTDDQSDEQLFLENGETLSATQARGMDAFRTGFRKMRPMVFLNACEVGRQVPALTGAGGFPRTFAQLGASGVIAPLWSVRDGCAHKVAVALYDAIREDARSGEAPRPVAEILRTIRARAYTGDEAGEDSYAAYCFYGDPSFVLRVGDT